MGRRKLIALALGLLALALSPIVPGTDANCVLAPHLADWTVSQGVGSYTPLAQGKEAGVRLYLTMPSCAARRDAIQLVGASLSVSGGTPGVVATPTPPVSATAPPTLGPLPAVDDSPSHPYFVVPGSMLARSDGAAFTAGFTATISYRSKPSNASTFSAIQTVALPATGAPAVSMPVARRSNGLRALVVPMGDLSQGYDVEFPAEAVAATQNAMRNLARQLPVNSEVGDLVDGTGAGLRYRINPGMVDLGQNGLNLMPDGKYCGKGESWTAIKGQLSSFLQAWNTANPSATADRVIGVIWQDNAVSVRAGTGCDEGIATINGREAWFRVSPEMGGAVVGMEVLHTLGGSVGTHADFGYHSKNIDADLSDPGRAFNLLLHRYLVDPRSTMRISDALWSESNTVYEPPDYELARCRLDDIPTGGTACPYGAEVGQAVSAGSVFSISGTVGASGSPVDLHSYFMPGSVERTETDPASRFEVVQYRSTGAIAQRDRIPARSLGTGHEPGHGDDHAHDGDVVIDAAVPVNTNAVKFSVLRDGVAIYTRSRGTAPTLTITAGAGAGDVRSWTDDPSQDDVSPSISPDGELVAWVDESGIRVRDVEKDLSASAAIDGTSPALSANDVLAFVRDGSIYTAPVTTSGSAVTVGSETLVYLGADPVLTGATQVTWGEGRTLVANIAGDLYEITPSLLPGVSITCSLVGALVGCVPVAATAGVDESDPAVSPDGELAYSREGTIWIDGEDTGIDGSDPAWGAEDLFFVDSGSVRDVPLDDIDASAAHDIVEGEAPTASDELLAFQSDEDGDDEIYLADLVDTGDLEIVATGGDVTLLRLDVLIRCDGSDAPLIVAAEPVAYEDGAAIFRVSIDTSSVCAGSMAVVRVTNGWLWSTQLVGPYGEEGDPIPAIAAPLDGDVLRQWDGVPVAGSATDESSDTTLSWELVRPDGTVVPLGSGPTLPDLSPPAGGWPTGTYRLRLTATDEDGNVGTTEVSFTIVADGDNDGMTDTEETCLGSGAANDPSNAYDDTDGDGIRNIDDPAPCTSAVNVSTDFEPNTLNLGSTGVPVTIRLTGAPVAGIDRSTVRISRIGGKTVHIPAQTWSVTAGVGSAQFDRLAVNNAVRSLGITGGYVAIVVEATSGSTSVHAVDPTAPVVNNS